MSLEHLNTSLNRIVDGNCSNLSEVSLGAMLAGLSPACALLPNIDENPQVLEEDELPPTAQVPSYR